MPSFSVREKTKMRKDANSFERESEVSGDYSSDCHPLVVVEAIGCLAHLGDKQTEHFLKYK